MKSIQVSVASGSRDTCMHARRADIANTPWEDPQRTTPITTPWEELHKKAGRMRNGMRLDRRDPTPSAGCELSIRVPNPWISLCDGERTEITLIKS